MRTMTNSTTMLFSAILLVMVLQADAQCFGCNFHSDINLWNQRSAERLAQLDEILTARSYQMNQLFAERVDQINQRATERMDQIHIQTTQQVDRMNWRAGERLEQINHIVNQMNQQGAERLDQIDTLTTEQVKHINRLASELTLHISLQAHQVYIAIWHLLAGMTLSYYCRSRCHTSPISLADVILTGDV